MSKTKKTAEKNITFSQMKWWNSFREAGANFPDVAIAPEDREAAERRLASFGEDWLERQLSKEKSKRPSLRREPEEVEEDILEGIALQAARRRVLTAAGLTRADFRRVIRWWKSVKNRRDIPPRQKVESLFKRLGVEGEFNPPAATTETLSLSLPEASGGAGAIPAARGFGNQGGGSAPPALAASPAAPGQPSALAAEVASNLAQKGASGEQIANALAGLRAAGLL